MFASINISEDFSDYMIEDQWLKNLSKINILIGANNSGKSRFLRRLFSRKSYHSISKEINVDKIEFIISETIGLLGSIEYRGPLVESIISLENNLKSIRTDEINHKITRLSNFFKNALAIFQHNQGFTESTHPYRTIHSILESYQTTVEQIIKRVELSENRVKIYIPILRGLRPIEKTNLAHATYNVHSNNYLDRCNTDYFDGQANADTIFTGLNLYNDTQRLLLGNTSDRKKIKEFESFLSDTFFNKQDVNIVPRINEDVLHIKIGEDEKPIYDLGDGIQSIIILTYPLFFNQDKYAVFFFEEPEMHLHPGLQRIFIDTLRRKEFEKYQYFMTTHSNHFLDLTLDSNDISVYTFTKSNEEKTFFLINNVASADNNILELIGVRNSSVFLSNCTIWVEGITDRLYIRKYLDVYQKSRATAQQFKEDLHYSFVEYGGSNITHWSFLESDDAEHSNIDVTRLCSKLFLITDSDNAGAENEETAGSAKSPRIKKLKEKLNNQYHCLDVREVENLLSRDTLKKTLDNYNANDTLDYTDFDKSSYDHEYLGRYIDNNVKGLKKKFAAKSGTISDKVTFCKRAIRNVDSVDDLSIEAKNLAQKLYEFIAKSNR